MMNVQEFCQGTCPTFEEFNEVINKMAVLYENDKLKDIIQALYKKYVQPSPFNQLTETIQAVKPIQKVKFKHQIEQILHFQKRIAAQTFIRKGYGILILQQEINKRGGLLEITQKRYKNDVTLIVIQAFTLATQYVSKSCGEICVNLCEKQTVCLQSILLNCRKYFSKEQVITFLKFVALFFEENCNEITVVRRQLFSFYNRARQLSKFKQENGRKAFKLKHSPQNTIIQQQSKAHLHQIRLLHVYLQVLSYTATRDKYQMLYGNHQQFNNVRNIQNVIFKVVRKIIKDIEQCHKRHLKLLPSLKSLNQTKIKRVLTNSDAATLRGKLIAFELAHNIKGENDVSHQLFQVDLVKLSEVIHAINKYLQNQGEKPCIQLIE